MKKKFIVFTLCFTLIFSSLNYKKSYALDFVITPTMVATIGSLVVGSGIILNNSDEIVQYSRLFYEKNKDNWENVKTVFNSCVSIGVNKVVTVGKEFLDIFNNTFDFLKEYNKDSVLITDSHVSPNDLFYATITADDVRTYGTPFVHPKENNWSAFGFDFEYASAIYGNETITYKYNYSEGTLSLKYLKDTNYYYYSCPVNNYQGSRIYFYQMHDNYPTMVYDIGNIPNVSSTNLPYVPGSYDDTVKDNTNEDGSIGVYVPGNVGDLIGIPGGSTIPGVGSPSYELPNNGQVTLPGYNDDVGLNVGGTDTFVPGDTVVPDVPGDTVVPGDTLFPTTNSIIDFIISLVVPSDTFWTDTWGGLYDNFTNSFPGVDMDNFNSLVTGEKKFPNIDINIMGVNGRVVNGDIVNSIVDWLRPIIAGFMMLCLMFFNYRKIYKLIRNSEPFPGIAQGTSDFKTGISEYNWRDNFVDINLEYEKFKKNGGNY